MVTAVDTVSSSSGPQQETTPWQWRLLPFMVGSLIVMGAFFLVVTLWLFVDLERRLDYTAPDLVTLIQTLPRTDNEAADREYAEWYARIILEKTALDQRFSMQKMVVKARLWTRFMGFLTGMILCFSGCVFVLGKLRESVAASAEGGGLKGALTTSSPGVFLAFAGTVLIGMSLSMQVVVESSDSPVYLPRQAQLIPANTESTPPTRAAPSGLDPVPSQQTAPDSQRGTPPPPPTVGRQIQQDRSSSR